MSLNRGLIISALQTLSTSFPQSPIRKPGSTECVDQNIPYVPRPGLSGETQGTRRQGTPASRSSVGRRETRVGLEIVIRHLVRIRLQSPTCQSVNPSPTHFIIINIRPVQGAKTKGSSQEGRIEAMLLRYLSVLL